jgi:hypothetical protein
MYILQAVLRIRIEKNADPGKNSKVRMQMWIRMRIHAHTLKYGEPSNSIRNLVRDSPARF